MGLLPGPWVCARCSAVAVAQAACQLLLLQVHDAHDVGQLVFVGLCLVAKQVLLLGHAHFGKEYPANTVELRQGDAAAKTVGEHIPQSLLKSLGIHAFQHFILADDKVGWQRIAQPRRIKLLARDAGEDHAMAPGKGQLALMWAIGLHQLRVALQRVDDLYGTVARLLQRVHDHFELTVGQNFKPFARCAANGLQMPVLGFQNQRAPARMHHDKIGTRLFGADRHIPPKPIIVFEFLLQPFCQPFFSAGHSPRATAERGN